MPPASSSEVAPPMSGGLGLAQAGAAASLAHANYTPVEPWRPGRQPAAGKAALFAHSQWRSSSEQPTSDAMQRANAAAYPKVQRPDALYSVAEKAMNETGHGQNGRIPTHSKGARSAAAGAMFRDMRKGSDSAQAGPDFVQRRNSHAMSAAVKSHRLSQAGGTIPKDQAIGDLKAPERFSAETEARLKQETMHATAVSMAREMYEVTTKLNGDRSPGAGPGSRQASRVGRPRVSSQPGLSTHNELSPYRYPANLHDHARRLVAQRMSSMYDEHQAYRDYYGVSPPSRSRSRIDRFRRRSSSASDAYNFDGQRSRKIRFEMSSFENRLDEIDSQRERDRAFLMEVAKRNVKLEMQHMDEMACAETGRPSPAMVQAWENKLKEHRDSADSGHIDTSGKVIVGGGAYAERDDVYSMAKGRLQPTFDDIKERAEEERARQIEERLDEEERQRLTRIEREREADMEEERKHIKALQKEQAKAEKSKKTERQRNEKEEHRFWKKKSKESKGKEPAADDSLSPEDFATSQEAETHPGQDDSGRAGAFAVFHRYGKDPSRMKNGESSRSQPSPAREDESATPVRIKRARSRTLSATKSDAERLRAWLRNRQRRTSPAADSRALQGREGEEALMGAPVQDAAQTPVVGTRAVEPVQEPMVTTQGYEEPSRATALRSHPVTDSDIPRGATSAEQPAPEAMNGQPRDVHDAANVEENATKAQNRRSKRFSFSRILGRNGKHDVGEETEAPVATTTGRGDDAPLHGPPRTTDTRISEPNIRDSRFVENI